MRYELQPAGRIEVEHRAGPRRSVRAIKLGIGTVVPIEPIALARGEVVGPPHAGKSERFSLDHPAVIARPELFRPTIPSADPGTVNVMVKRLLRRKREGALRGVPAWIDALELDEPRRAGSARGRWRLP
jgi:hypothetical protein